MGTASFESGTLIRWNGDDYRLLRMVDDVCQLQREKTLRITDVKTPELLSALEEGRLQFPSRGEVSHCGQALSLVSEEELEEAKLKLIYVKASIGVSASLPLLANVSEEVWKKIKQPATRPSATSLYQWRKRFLEAGSDLRALVGRHRSKGNRKSRYPAEVIAKCQEAIGYVYLSRERGSVKDTVERAKSLVRQENADRPKSLQLPPPTRRLVDRLISQIPDYDKCAYRYGATKARQLYRSVKGHYVTARPLERVEMDHTLLDVVVVDERTGAPLGRPYFTACIDDYTRCILGVYIGPEPPSGLTVASSLRDCFRPKTKLRDMYPSIKNSWDACGVMDVLSVDNGAEFHGPLEKLAHSLNIELEYSPRKTPQGKGKIERFFGTLNSGLIHTLPGTTFRNVAEKGDYDSEKNARLTMSELRELVIKWIVDVYHHSRHGSLDTSPAATWKESAHFENLRFPDDSLVMEAITGRSEVRTLSHKGIEFAGLLFNSDEMAELRRIHGQQISVEVRIDETDLGAIYVLHPTTGITFRVPALKQEYAAGLSLWLHKVYRNKNRTEGRGNSSDELMLSREEIRDMVAVARSKRTFKGKRALRHAENTRPDAPPQNSNESVRATTGTAKQENEKNRETFLESEHYEKNTNQSSEPAKIRPRLKAILRQ